MDNMIIFASVGVVVAIAALLWFANRQMGVVLASFTDVQKPAETSPAPVYDDAEVWRAIDRLAIAVAEGIEHVDKKNKRIDGVVASAKRRFEAEGYIDPPLEAETGVLPLRDEFSGTEQGMLPLPNDVEAAPSPFQGVPGSLPRGWGE